ncbi:MAG: metal ABC transporter substrate-binding protein [Candidatus Kapabacteria bacterium]|nr:metal ABC transporter substrate-binding protein [Candidatus Kapabacteria bacterium]
MKILFRTKVFKFIIVVAAFIILNACSEQKDNSPKYTVTCLPLKYILMEIIGNEEDIAVLVDAGYSPHTYAPPPSVMKKMENSKVIFFVEDHYDKWAIKDSYKNLTEVFKLLPESFIIRFDEHEVDPHFWTDPLAVKTIVPDLTQILIEKEPEKAEIFKENANKFMDKLNQLDQKINDILEPVKGSEVFLFHPSFNYMLKRYGLIYAGSIEESPGKEPSPKYISDLIAKIKKSQTKSIFSEPQLSEKSAESIAEAAGLNIYVLDPLGGIDDRNNYFNLMLYNAQILLKALSN